jgi:hypothetical protein
MRNIEAMGGLNTRSIRQLREVGIATPQRLYEALAAELHTTAKGAEGMLKSGRISQEQSINTLLKLVQTRIDKGSPLGEYALERSKGNLDTQIKNFKESFESMFESLDTKPAARAVAELSKAFDPATASGAHMRDVIQSGFNGITRAIDYSREHMAEWINFAEKAVKVVEALLKVPKFIFDVGYKAGGAIASVATGDAFTSRTAKNEAQADKDTAAIERMNAQIDALQKATASKVESNTQLENAMNKSGINAGSGFVQGLANSLEAGNVPDVIHQYVVKEVDRALDIHSPSRVMGYRGRMAARGFNNDFRDEMRGSPFMSFGMSGGGSWGGMGFSSSATASAPAIGSSTLHVDISGTIRVEGSGAGNPQQLADMSSQLEQICNRSIQRAFESLGRQN